MKRKINYIGSFEAKTHLSKVLKDVQKGSEIIITIRGKPVAKITPYSDNKDQDINYILDSFEKIRNSIKNKIDIKSMINEGRKY